MTVPGPVPAVPSPHELWQQACDEIHPCASHSRARRAIRYRELLREHGHLVDRQPGDDPNLPCGWPGTAS